MDILERAENLDGYRAACAKSSSNREAREEFLYELASISPKAANVLSDTVRSLPLLKGCQFAILDSSAEGGLPHTRPPNVICLPYTMCKDSSSAHFIETLVHEGIHIHQRTYPLQWNSALRRAGWEPISKDRIPEEFQDRVRLNPDTVLTPFWSFNKKSVPLPLFRADRPPTFGNVAIEWMDLRTGALFHQPPKEFTEKYGSNIHQPEHPYEIYAELFAGKKIQSNDKIFINLNEL